MHCRLKLAQTDALESQLSRNIEIAITGSLSDRRKRILPSKFEQQILLPFGKGRLHLSTPARSIAAFATQYYIFLLYIRKNQESILEYVASSTVGKRKKRKSQLSNVSRGCAADIPLRRRPDPSLSVRMKWSRVSPYHCQ